MPDFAVLDNVSHADLRVDVRFGQAHGNCVNQALVFPTEFQALQREYPIYFRRADDDDTYYAVVLLGLDQDENLYLEQDSWQARYVPAIHASGPFVLEYRNAPDSGDSAAQDPVVRVDLQDARVGSETGQNVFLPHGGYSPYFEEVLRTLRRVHVGARIAGDFFAKLAAFDLIEAVTVQAKLSDALTYTIPDLFTISQQRLASLSAEELQQLNHLGLLEHCFAVVFSAGNMSRLADLKALKSRLEG